MGFNYGMLPQPQLQIFLRSIIVMLNAPWFLSNYNIKSDLENKVKEELEIHTENYTSR